MSTDATHTPSVLVVPGLGDSGPDHWQTRWQHRIPGCGRLMLHHWDEPKRAVWTEGLERAYRELDSDFVVVAHSLGCTATIHWVNEFGHNPRAALMVAPADVDQVHRRLIWPDFCPMPDRPLPFPSVVVTSTNDPWLSVERARLFAEWWDSEYIEIGEAGHISTVDGYGDWPFGWNLLQRLLR